MNVGILPNVNSTKQKRDKCLFPHHKVDEQPNKKPKKGYHSPQKQRKRRQECCGCCENCTTNGLRLSRLGNIGFSKRQTVLWFTQSTLRQASILENKGPSLGKIQVKNLHQRSPSAMKFEDRSQEETARQQRCAQSKALNLAQNKYKLKGKDQVTFYSPWEEWVLPAASTREPEEKESVVDSGASMHVVSKRDLNSAELETVKISKSPTTVMTANGEV